ncbi:Oxidoreductase, Gfo/Idh/MocA family [Acidisarcina polymorpha]|uniref:Oxidoreductase, Gfo/Idh/MocA family n=1 Tax=Acidisarcina polymorpha TaxID=2211140 RepID=A0A2Z5FYD9_9BACT|nr:Gfo/Idh/MocA family oxidoreductase [Acidisarcina polymorpha]AXC11868.1 Oxidoreductase, Gfo/Idh/MocA family [Acidisarcina polymorpha]
MQSSPAQARESFSSAVLVYPKRPRPIVIIGAGGIVRAAHLPAYEKAQFPVIGIMDELPERAAGLAAERHIPRSFNSLTEAIRFAPSDAIFDVAVPASQLLRILPEFKDGSAVLMQKPMGETLAEARAIRDLCRRKNLIASVNFSLRYSPNNLAVRSLAEKGMLGELVDVEVQTSTYTPWHLWSFLANAPRLEILYHSIHYFDLIRSWLGNPRSVYAKTVKSPEHAHLAPTKTVAILDYGDAMRVFVATNHNHNFGPEHQHSFVQWEGLKGAARMTMGLNLDYPTGKPDSASFAKRGANQEQWQSIPITGNNFPDGFMGTMGALQAFVEGSASTLPTHFEDAYQTMALVEALYESSESGGVVLNHLE